MNNECMYLKFIGRDGSMGLRHGNKYKVNLYTHGAGLIAHIRINMFLNVTCPYDTLIGFSKNWEVAK